MSLSILIGSADFSALSFAFLQMLQEDEFDIICHGAVFTSRKRPYLERCSAVARIPIFSKTSSESRRVKTRLFVAIFFLLLIVFSLW